MAAFPSFYPSVPRSAELRGRSFLAVSAAGQLHTFTFSGQNLLTWITPDHQHSSYQVTVIKADTALFLAFITDENPLSLRVLALRPEGKRAAVWLFYQDGTPALTLYPSASAAGSAPIEPQQEIRLFGEQGPVLLQKAPEQITITAPNHAVTVLHPQQVDCFREEKSGSLFLSLASKECFFFVSCPQDASSFSPLAHGISEQTLFSTPGCCYSSAQPAAAPVAAATAVAEEAVAPAPAEVPQQAPIAAAATTAAEEVTAPAPAEVPQQAPIAAAAAEEAAQTPPPVSPAKPRLLDRLRNFFRIFRRRVSN